MANRRITVVDGRTIYPTTERLTASMSKSIQYHLPHLRMYKIPRRPALIVYVDPNPENDSQRFWLYVEQLGDNRLVFAIHDPYGHTSQVGAMAVPKIVANFNKTPRYMKDPGKLETLLNDEDRNALSLSGAPSASKAHPVEFLEFDFDVRPFADEPEYWCVRPVSLKADRWVKEQLTAFQGGYAVPPVCHESVVFRILRRLRANNFRYDERPTLAPHFEALKAEEEAEWRRWEALYAQQGKLPPW